MSGPGQEDVSYAKKNERYLGREQKSGKEKQVTYDKHYAVTHRPVTAAYENTLTYVNKNSCQFSSTPRPKRVHGAKAGQCRRAL